jgi:hypothetical protein
MERRAFIWKVATVPLAACAVLDEKVISAVAPKFEANSHYILFADAQAMNIEHLTDLIPGTPPLPDNCFIEIVPLKLRNGQTIDDAVRLYQVSDARP